MTWILRYRTGPNAGPSRLEFLITVEFERLQPFAPDGTPNIHSNSDAA